jgi:hypothetical protein
MPRSRPMEGAFVTASEDATARCGTPIRAFARHPARGCRRGLRCGVFPRWRPHCHGRQRWHGARVGCRHRPSAGHHVRLFRPGLRRLVLARWKKDRHCQRGLDRAGSGMPSPAACLTTMTGHTLMIYTAAFSPDGGRISSPPAPTRRRGCGMQRPAAWWPP